MSAAQHLRHGFGPVYDGRSRVLILGSFPSAMSRAQQFYYGHPRNRFWPVLAAVLDEPTPRTVEEKRALALRRGVALWDAIEECDIVGSSDSSIRNAVPTDLPRILRAADIRAVFVNGAAAERVYRRWQRPLTGLEARYLPSTSPANAAWSFARLVEAWKVILDWLE